MDNHVGMRLPGLHFCMECGDEVNIGNQLCVWCTRH